jgi:hypothetical protein
MSSYISSMKETTNMKTTKTPNIGYLLVARESHNVTLINHSGSPSTTQIWEGNLQAVADYVMKKIADGLDENNDWDEPYLFAFITPHGDDERTCMFDLRDESHLEFLRNWTTPKI